MKAIRVDPIRSDSANAFVKKHHYSGKVVQNSQLHFGAFYDGVLHGVMSFGPSLDKRKIQGLVAGTLWNEFLELNRMAFDDFLPKNSESRCIAVAMRLIRKNYPQIKWVVSFADGTQCGDGTIYRASGFVLTGIVKSTNLVRRGDGIVVHKMTLESNPTAQRPELGGRSYYEITGGKYNFEAYRKATDGVIIPGFQLRYIYFIDKAYQSRLTVPVVSFAKIDEMGAGMYKGANIKIADRKPCAGSETVTRPPIQAGEGGSIPTPALTQEASHA